MASEARNQGSNIDSEVQGMQEDIRAYDFTSAIRRMECLFPDKSRVGASSRINEEVLRLSQHINLGFAGPTLESLTQANGQHHYRLNSHFFGLLGTNGPMPLHYTEYADQRRRHHRDPTFAEFIDIFNHRFFSHFYRAISIFDPSINMDRPGSNEFDLFIGSLGGYAPAGSKKRDTINDHAKQYYVGILGNKSKNPDGIKALVSDYFGFKTKVTEFIGGWLKLPANDRAVLKKNSIMLGKNIYIGQRVWSISHKFKLTIGPLLWHDYVSFKPGGNRSKELSDLVRNYIGDEWDWDLELLVSESRVKPLKLDRTCSLGFTSWLAGESANLLEEQSVVINKSALQ